MTASTTPTIDTDRIEAAARALHDSRITAVRTLAEARQSRDDHRAVVLAAEGRDAAAYAAALRAGWTAEELKHVGLDAPSTRTPGRPAPPRPEPSTRTRARARPGQERDRRTQRSCDAFQRTGLVLGGLPRRLTVPGARPGCSPCGGGLTDARSTGGHHGRGRHRFALRRHPK